MLTQFPVHIYEKHYHDLVMKLSHTIFLTKIKYLFIQTIITFSLQNHDFLIQML